MPHRTAMASRHESVMIEIRELMDDHHKRKVENLKSTTDAELPDNLAERSSILERNVLGKDHIIAHDRETFKFTSSLS